MVRTTTVQEKMVCKEENTCNVDHKNGFTTKETSHMCVITKGSSCKQSKSTSGWISVGIHLHPATRRSHRRRNCERNHRKDSWATGRTQVHARRNPIPRTLTESDLRKTLTTVTLMHDHQRLRRIFSNEKDTQSRSGNRVLNSASSNEPLSS